MDKNNGAIYDARKLGKPKMIILGVQHMFAMFGATILVPILTGLDISTTLLMAGLGTLLFHCITKFKVPAFLGSSFAFWEAMPQSRHFHPTILTVCSRMRALALRVQVLSTSSLPQLSRRWALKRL